VHETPFPRGYGVSLSIKQAIVKKINIENNA